MRKYHQDKKESDNWEITANWLPVIVAWLVEQTNWSLLEKLIQKKLQNIERCQCKKKSETCTNKPKIIILWCTVFL